MGHHTRRGRSMVLLQDKDAPDSKEPQMPDRQGELLPRASKGAWA